ncbi:ImmA/IrrE family metallo-endopeptidase [Streptomyces sp. G-5]|uniref:ImmA/IrrE family metallo-endopeptidase n=1 Tax=Streptomyces sp. G-5 TaxID=2977231 RepID=UPI0021D11FF7|nr:ImmA/IrrE family metallo-endopeptidase [Streptomyces sp. G-5]MCU4749463.1 ImmA/IrrE family metallo-endopeptidase [Streptomyces sp. G-5]
MNTLPLPHATARDLGEDAIEDIAEETRTALRLAPDKPIPHLIRALERAGLTVASTPHLGVSHWAGIGEPSLIGYFPSTGDRDRFTFAHELGHMILHSFRPRAADPEQEANGFAAALPVPSDRTKESITDPAHPQRLRPAQGDLGCVDPGADHARRLRGQHRRESQEVAVRPAHPARLAPGRARPRRRQGPAAAVESAPARLRRSALPPRDRDLAIHPTVLRSIAPQPASAHPEGGTPAKTPAPANPGGKVVQFKRRSA